MKIQNVSLDNAYAITRGWVGKLAAAGTGLIQVVVGGTTVSPASSLTINGESDMVTATDDGSQGAVITVRPHTVIPFWLKGAGGGSGSPGPPGPAGANGATGATGPAGPLGASAKATASGTVTTSASLQDITGASVSLAAGTYVITGLYFLVPNTALNDRTFEGHLDVNGSDQTDIASIVPGSALVGDATFCSQQWLVTLGSTQTVKLRTKHSGGTTGTFTTQTTCVITAVQAGGTANLTVSTASLGSDTAFGNNGTYADGPSLTLSAGSYVLMGHLYCQAGTTTPVSTVAKLWDGTNVVSSDGFTVTSNNYRFNLSFGGYVTPAGSTTYKISASTNSSVGSLPQMQKNSPDAGNPGPGSWIWALKVA